MIESMNDASRNLEKALQALKQAQQRVANEKKVSAKYSCGFSNLMNSSMIVNGR